MTPDMDHIGAERKAMRKLEKVALSHFFDILRGRSFLGSGLFIFH